MFKKSCLNCKHHTFYYTANSIKCNHDLFPEFTVNDESKLENIAGNCDYFENKINVEQIYIFSINEQEICRLGGIIKREYLLESHTQNSLRIAFYLIAKSAINLYAKNYADENWCLETLKNQELVKELANKLQHYFIEVYQ
jgi:hypothetical protein